VQRHNLSKQLDRAPRRRVFVLACVVWASAAAPARAQPRIGVFGHVVFGSRMMAASESFDAVTGSDRTTFVSGGARIERLWKGVFADTTFSQTSFDGERVFVNNGEVFGLGIPVRVTVRPIDLAAGWRFAIKRFSPFAGGGVTFLSYRESSEFSDPADEADEQKTGAIVLAGLDYQILRWARAGVEMRYRRVGGILGEAGVSELFDEKNAGGIDFGVRVSVGRE
jgi:opacity protein-like surface antigen